jgi:hypothetical protein
MPNASKKYKKKLCVLSSQADRKGYREESTYLAKLPHKNSADERIQHLIFFCETKLAGGCLTTLFQYMLFL